MGGERPNVSDSARGKVFGGERLIDIDRARWKWVGGMRPDVTDFARGNGSVGRDVMLQILQGGKVS